MNSIFKNDLSKNEITTTQLKNKAQELLRKIKVNKNKSLESYYNAIDNFVDYIEFLLSIRNLSENENNCLNNCNCFKFCLQILLFLVNEPETFLFDPSFSESNKAIDTLKWIVQLKEIYPSINSECLNKAIKLYKTHKLKKETKEEIKKK